MRRFLVVNPGSGDGSPGPAELARAADQRGIEVHVLGEGDDLVALARRSAADVIGMAGGDGSLGAVAAVAVERDIPFVCVPFGTRNHFARDLGLDRDDPIGALAAFDGGHERRVDLGFAGDRAFLNNASVGLYAELVERREHHRRRGAVLARLRALALAARRPDPTHLLLDGEPVAVRILLVANNAYALRVLELGARERLDEGLLHVYLAEGFLPRGWRELPARRELVVEPRQGALALALDGEPVEMAGPLRLRSAPAALRVLVPRLREGDGTTSVVVGEAAALR